MGGKQSCFKRKNRIHPIKSKKERTELKTEIPQPNDSEISEENSKESFFHYDPITMVSSYLCCSKAPMVYDPLEDEAPNYLSYEKEPENEIKAIESKVIRISVLTWNLGGKSSPKELELKSIIQSMEINDEKNDIYVIGTQECCRSINKSFINSSKEKWENALKKYFFQNGEFKILKSMTLVATHLIIFVKNDLVKEISKINVLQIPTGYFKDSLGNKGAVSISFRLEKKNYMFINCHLTPYYNNQEARNKNYSKIINYLSFFYKKPIFNLFDGIFFFGDTNYRINGNRKIVDNIISKLNDENGNEMFEILKNNDQLYRSKKEAQAFCEFKEGKITFKPTYKFDMDSSNYDTSKKKRIPSWTDRILYRGNDVELLEYNAHFKCLVSDHRPVYAVFDCK